MPQIPNRERYQEVVSDALRPILKRQELEVRKLLREGRKPSASFWKKVDDEISHTAAITLQPLHKKAARQFSQKAPREITKAANDYAVRRGRELAAELRETTTKGLAELRSRIARLEPGAARNSVLKEGLVNLFGQARSDRIASYEVGKAWSAGELSDGDGYEWYWKNGPKPCPRCRKLQNKPRRVWKRVAPDGPPLHPHCYCTLVAKRKK